MAKTIPDSHVNRKTFFNNLLQQITDNATALGWDTAKVAGATATLQPVASKYTVLVDADDAATQAGVDAEKVFGLQKPSVQMLIDELRSNPNCNGAMLSAMQLIPASTSLDINAIQPVINVKADTGYVRITGTKNYADLVNLYMRRAGQTVWMQIATNRRKLPFDDQTPLATAGVPEVREYMARGVINDAEIGLPSDIVTVTYAG